MSTLGKEERSSKSFTPLDFIINTTMDRVMEKVMRKVGEKFETHKVLNSI